jgi:hypothetical protein
VTAEQTFRSLDQFDLLPPSFRYQNRVRQIFCSWLTVVFTLVAILCGVTAATTLRMHQQRQRNQQIAATAIALWGLRRDVTRLQQENDRRDQWCRQVQAARPGDDLLQTLAAITLASQTEDRAIKIDSLDVRQEVEFPASAKQTPPWATGRIVIEARATAEVIEPWLDRLNSFDRIDAAAVRETTPSGTDNPLLAQPNLLRDQAQPIEVHATPLATRVLP